jgi:hypothetical protein
MGEASKFSTGGRASNLPSLLFWKALRKRGGVDLRNIPIFMHRILYS